MDDPHRQRQYELREFHGLRSSLHELHDPCSDKYVANTRWCINREDLRVFENEVRELWESGGIPDHPEHPNCFHDDPRVGPTIHQVNEYYIKPKTWAAGGMSWSLMRHPEGLQCDVFATHCWSEGVFEFISKVQRVWPRDADNLDVCFTANPQNGDMVSEVLSRKIEESPFAQCLGVTRYLLVIPNRAVSIYYRLWCVYEAYLAIRATESRDLKIKLPWDVAPLVVARKTLPGVLMPVAGFSLSHFVLAEQIASLLGPLMWILLSFGLSYAGAEVMYWIAHHTCYVADAILWMIVFEYIEMFMVGLGAGLAWWHLKGLGDGSNDLVIQHIVLGVQTFGVRFEKGEEIGIVFLLASMTAAYLYKIFVVLIHDVIEKEGTLLYFETVRDAHCTGPEDERKIKEVISGYEDDIDEAIQTLRAVGRYDRAVKQNLDLGMSAARIRQGIDPFKVITACVAWQFWWITDLAARKNAWAYVLPVAFAGTSLALVYFIGERSIFAIESSLWTGIGFLVISNFHHWFWRGPVLSWNMSGETVWLQLGFVALMLSIDVLFYCGYFKEVSRCSRRCCCDDDDMVTSDADEESEALLSERWSERTIE